MDRKGEQLDNDAHEGRKATHISCTIELLYIERYSMQEVLHEFVSEAGVSVDNECNALSPFSYPSFDAINALRKRIGWRWPSLQHFLYMLFAPRIMLLLR